MAIELTSSEVGDFFQERGVSWDCPICKTAGWVTIGPEVLPDLPVVTAQWMTGLSKVEMEKYAAIGEDEKLLPVHIRERYLALKNLNNPSKSIGLPVLVLVCAHCGFVRTHAAYVIKNKKVGDIGGENG